MSPSLVNNSKKHNIMYIIRYYVAVFQLQNHNKRRHVLTTNEKTRK